MPRKRTPTEAEAHFWSRVDKSAGPDACWPWVGSRNQNRYGRTQFGGRMRYAHRIAYELTNGPIPAGGSPLDNYILHRCDNRVCCNPAHLWLGTHLENVADMVAKGRQAAGDRSGSRTHPERIARGERHSSRLHPEIVPRGESHFAAKLTAEKVRSIRAARTDGATYTQLAAQFGVHLMTVADVVREKTWRHVK